MMYMLMNDASPHAAVEIPTGTDYNLRTDVVTTKALQPGHATGGSWTTAFIRSGTTLTATATSADPLDIGAWTDGVDFILVHNAGTISGKGGAGGAAGSTGAGSAGSVGGDAILTTVAITIDNPGTVGSGSGGGGGDGTICSDSGKGCECTDRNSGGTGTDGLGAAGSAGSGNDSTNGCSDHAGGAGGVAGNYINGSAKTTWVATGTRSGNTT